MNNGGCSVVSLIRPGQHFLIKIRAKNSTKEFPILPHCYGNIHGQASGTVPSTIGSVMLLFRGCAGSGEIRFRVCFVEFFVVCR